MWFNKLSIAAALLGLVATGSQAHAAYIVTFQQVGSDVVATGSGTLNTSALSFGGVGSGNGNVGYVQSGKDIAFIASPTFAPADSYTGAISGPTDFGGGSGFGASSGSGDLAGIWVGGGQIVVASGYVSNAALSDSATWSGATFSSLGITPGTYTWTWGSGDTADSFTLETVAPPTTPEPASLCTLGLGAIGLLARRRRNGVSAGHSSCQK